MRAWTLGYDLRFLEPKKKEKTKCLRNRYDLLKYVVCPAIREFCFNSTRPGSRPALVRSALGRNDSSGGEWQPKVTRTHAYWRIGGLEAAHKDRRCHRRQLQGQHSCAGATIIKATTCRKCLPHFATAIGQRPEYECTWFLDEQPRADHAQQPKEQQQVT